MNKVRVAVNRYGAIGKRVADAAALQEDMALGLVTLNSTAELMADLGHPRGDMWEDILWVDGDRAYYTYQVFNQAIVIPETIDAIRALSGIEADPAASIAWTDASLGLQRDFIRDRDSVRQ